MTSSDMLTLLTQKSFVVTKENAHAIELNNNGRIVYVCPEMKSNIVISPEQADRIGFTGKLYHNSNMTQFPKKMNKGETPINYGVKYTFDNEVQVEEFLQKLMK